MTAQLHHVALNTAHFEESVRFFEMLFEMEVSRTAGEKPSRMLWFRQGIQINEVIDSNSTGNRYDHVGIQVPDWQATRRRAAEMGCIPVEGKPHWFVTPEGVVIELKESSARVK